MAVAGTRTGVEPLVAARRLSAAIAAGALVGMVVGGVGGRIAMLVLRLTSDPRLHGLSTDDGFTIGTVSSSTLFLLGLTAILGALGGTAYLLVRRWLPERLRPWAVGALAGVIGGTSIIRPGGVDFTLLDPLALAITMFVAIPAAGGVAIALLAERFLRDGSAFERSRVALALLVLVVPVGVGFLSPIGFGVLIAVGAVVVLTGRGPDVARLWGSAPVTWLGRAALVVVGVVASTQLWREVAAVL